MQLTQTQRQIIEAALTHPQTQVVWFPDHINGGARSAILRKLISKGLVIEDQNGYRLTDLAQQGLGAVPVSLFDQAPTEPSALETEPLEAVISMNTDDSSAEAKVPRATKQQLVIEMLEHAEGATIDEICEATGWLPHTVRGTFAGAFKKKLGLNIQSEKQAPRGRIYRIVSSSEPENTP